MSIDKSKLTYRRSTIAVVLDKNNRILLVQKQSYHDNEWEFPGGGVDEGEIDEQAIERELGEELGTDKFELIRRGQLDYQYDWPDEVIEKKFEEKGMTWLGQKRAQFLVKFMGQPQDIKFQKEEIRRVIWVDPSESDKYFVFPNQLSNSKKLLEEFGLI
jgi:mutator protein MutT